MNRTTRHARHVVLDIVRAAQHGCTYDDIIAAAAQHGVRYREAQAAWYALRRGGWVQWPVGPDRLTTWSPDIPRHADLAY